MLVSDCLDVVSTLKRHAVNVDDEELMLDLRVLESYLQTKHFNNALSVSCFQFLFTYYIRNYSSTLSYKR